MPKTPRSRSDAHRRIAVACALSTAALLGAAACAGQGANTASSQGGTRSTTQSTAPSTTSAAPSAAATASKTSSTGGSNTARGSAASLATAGAPQQSAAAAHAAPACGNSDLKISLGGGTQSQPFQAGGVTFTNVGGHTCTLQGYPGAAITVDQTVINATRVLNGFRGAQPPLSSPPLVTLKPGASAYSVIAWKLAQKGENCYPNGPGTISITAPNTTRTVVVSSAAQVGTQGICSDLEINPVVPTAFFAPAPAA